MTQRRRAFLWTAATLAALPPWARAAPDDAPIRIGLSLGLTGVYDDVARFAQRAYLLWERQINARGGMLGRRVQFVIHDDRSDPETSRRIYEDLIRKERVELVLGPYSSQITAAAALVAEHHGYPMLAPGAASEDIWKRGNPYVFGVYPQAGRYAIGFLAVLAEAGVERIAIVAADDNFSMGVAEGMRKWAGQYKLAVAHWQVEPKKQPDMARAATAAREAGAQALLMAGHFDESVAMRRALKQIGWQPRAYYATVGPATQKYIEHLGPEAQGTFSTSQWEAREDLRYPGSLEFLRAYRAAYQEDPSYHAAAAYAACQVLERAVARVGRIDRAALREAYAALDMYTPLGRYSVDRTGMQVKGIPLIVQWQGGKREIVWPLELRTAAPQLDR
jgi:branched-chain amino acid transport system substrate-binding protein